MGPIDPFTNRSPSAKQRFIAKALKGKMGIARERLVRAVRIFFFNGGIAPNKATSSYLKTMLDAGTKHGLGIKAPTPYEIGHHYVERECEATVAWVNTFRRAWRDRLHTRVMGGLPSVGGPC